MRYVTDGRLPNTHTPALHHRTVDGIFAYDFPRSVVVYLTSNSVALHLLCVCGDSFQSFVGIMVTKSMFGRGSPRRRETLSMRPTARAYLEIRSQPHLCLLFTFGCVLLRH